MRARVEQLESEARKLHVQLQDEQRLSLIDSLTQIPNRQAFESRFEEEVGRFQRFSQPTCIALWDIDLFKSVNDKFGHRAGDKVLKVVAESLAGGIRSTDFLARFGGEEFVLLLPGTRVEDALRVTDSLRNAVALLGFHFRGTPVSVTISCGSRRCARRHGRMRSTAQQVVVPGRKIRAATVVSRPTDSHPAAFRAP